MSQSTIVNLMPFDIVETKPGQFPSLYVFKKAEKGDLTVTVIGEAHFQELVPYGDAKTPPRVVEILSAKVAKSIVDDHIAANLAISYELIESPYGDAQALPGIFWLEGSWDKDSVKKNHSSVIKLKEYGMKKWFGNLVKIGDDDWKRYGRHNVISDLQRSACTYLGLERPWNFDPIESEVKLCPACATTVSPFAAICQNCRCIVNQEKYAKLQFAGSSSANPFVPQK